MTSTRMPTIYVHNMQGFGRAMAGAQPPRTDSATFDAWLADTIALPRLGRDDRLEHWQTAPAARACHPREEHLLPLMGVAGAAADDTGTLPFRDVIPLSRWGVRVSAVRFG